MSNTEREPNIPSRTVVGHCKRDETDHYVGRGRGGVNMLDVGPGTRGWLGNPFTLEDHERGESVRRYRQVFEWRIQSDGEFRAAVEDLSGSRLGCWCQELDQDTPACHGEVIAEWADRLAAGEGRP